MQKNIYDEKKYVFVLCASTNIDRIAAFYHAIPKGRYFICDQYQKDILDIVSENSKEKTNLYNFEKIHTYGNNLDEKMLKNGFCMLVRANSYYKEIMDKFPDDTAYVYSLWQGYASKENTNISEFIKKYDFKSVHTSGHASVCDLKAVYDVVCPTLEIISIHSTKPNKLKEYYPEIKIIKLEDGEVLKI